MVERPDYATLLKDAYHELKRLRGEVEKTRLANSEPLAIIGMGCRFPSANTPDEYWEMLVNKGFPVSEIPPTRWDMESFLDPETQTTGSIRVGLACLLDTVAEFDAPFFGISPREAKRLDPQQRLIMEVAWEALENAGYNPMLLSGSNTGVYIGVGNSDYNVLQADERESIDAYFGTGNSRSITANRLSYFLNLTGPSIVVDTACSSSLVALDLATSALRRGEIDLALVGGVSLILSPELSITFSQAQMLAPDGKCKTFDASANGYVRGEGAGTIVLKRLSDAERDGDFIHAVIRGTAVNQDGRSNGLTAPNGSAQMEVLKKALQQSGLKAADIDFVEAHGTGTSLGDPIEMIALGQVYGQGHSKQNPLYVGSVKTNIGHLEAAAGMASIIKVVLSLSHQQIPPHLHFETPSPYIPWDRIPVIVPTELITLQDKSVHRAGVSGFGFGGTNAHAILESYHTERNISTVDDTSDRTQIIKLSAHTANSLAYLATRLGTFIEHSPTTLEDIAYTLNHGRADFEQRVAFIATSKHQFATQLQAFIQGRNASHVISRHVSSTSNGDVVFMFTGQGSQFVGMFRELYEDEPIFRQHLEYVATLATPFLGISLLEILYSSQESDPRIHLTQYTQPILFAVEYSLAQLWMSWGILPSAVIGHSVGEVVAAVISGVLSIEDGVRLITARGRLMGDLPQGGTMVACFASATVIAPALAGYESLVSIAAVNSPNETVLSGERNAVHAIIQQLEKQHGIQYRELTVSHAFHSPLMEPILDEFFQIAQTLHYEEPTIPYISNLTGQFVESDTVNHAHYWVEHIRNGVHFAQGIQSLYDDSYRIFLEIGPRPILSAMGRRTLNDDDSVWVASSRPPRSDHEQVFEALAQLYVNGVSDIRWDVVSAGYKIPLPTYAFERHYYWWSDQAQAIQREVSSIAKAQLDNVHHAPSIMAENLTTSDPAPVPTENQNDFIQHLSSLDDKSRREFLTDFLRQQVASVLGASVSTITEHQRFFDLGLDSLMSVELKNRLDKAFEVSLSLTLAFDYPSVAKLTDYLLSDVLMLQAQLQEDHQAKGAVDHNEPIAVIGMAVRLPGGANDLDGYWHLLQSGTDAIIPVPASRWDESAYYNPDYNMPGKTYSKGGGFLTVPVDEFDPLFFGISPREADGMDPQHRLLLEMSWEALEHANLSIRQLEGSSTGVFVGINTNDYLQIIFENGLESIDPTMATGSTFSAAAGRISYVLGLQGPSIAVDTACSSSLVTIHMACQSLRNHESNLALAGGVNLILSPMTTIGMAKLRALATDGHCKTFDAQADGYGRGEGAGMVVLKRLSDALADGDHVWAVVRGSAVTQDGASGGLTVPNGPAQQAVIQHALHAAGVLPHEVDYVEAHGTGTPLGDPIEMNALHAVLARGRHKTKPLYVGSVKTNIGHLEAAAGIAGFVKLVLSMHHQHIPPHINFHTPSPNIDWENMAIEVPTQLIPWRSENKPRIAGVSSFGFSGTNAHIIVQEGIIPVDSPRTPSNRPLHWLALSARSEASLAALAQRYASLIPEQPTLSLLDLAYTAHTSREHFAYRATFAAQNHEALAQQLLSPFNISQAGRVQPKVAWMFTGQGSQMVGMARELYETSPVFQHYLNVCVVAFDRHLPRSLYEVIFEDDATNSIHQTRYTQPALFAVEIALAYTLLEWGMKPDFLIGHSIGEIVAACVAGIFSMDDAILLVVERARLMDALPSGGGMLAVFASEVTVQASLESFQHNLQIAGLNHDHETVVSGDLDSLRAYAILLKEQGISTQALTVSHAFHSHLMEPMLESFNQVLESITFHPPHIPISSNVTGKIGVADEMMRPSYWVNHVRRAVRFADGMKSLYAEGVRLFIEVGSRPILSNMGNRLLGDAVEFIPLLHPRQSNWQTIYQVLDRYYRLGFSLDWAQLDLPYLPSKVTVPNYVFDRKRHWLKTPTTVSRTNLAKTTSTEQVTSKPITLANGVRIYEGLPNLAEGFPFLDGKPVLLGEAVLAWVSSLSPELGDTLYDVEIMQSGTMLEDKTPTKLQAVFTPVHTDQFSLEVFIQFGDEAWQMMLRAMLSKDRAFDGMVLEDFQAWDVLSEYSSPFVFSSSPMVNIFQLHNDKIIRFDESVSLPLAMVYGLQCYGYGMSSLSMARFSHYSQTAIQTIHLKANNTQTDIAFWDADNRLVAYAEHVITVDVLDSLRGHSQWQDIQNWFYDFSWMPTDLTADSTKRLGHWLVFADPANNLELASAMEEVATRVTYVIPADHYTFSDNRITVRLNIQEDLERALAQSSGVSVLQGVLFAWNLTEATSASLDAHTLLNYQERIPMTLLQLASALSKAGVSARLWGVTVGSQAVGDGAITEHGLLDSMLWGLGRVITLELPEIWGGMIDLDPHSPEFKSLINEMVTRHNEDQIAYRNQIRYVARLVPQVTPTVFKPFALKRDAAYLITGGLGKLGLLVATWMAERGAGHIILTSRAGLPSRSEWISVVDESLKAKFRTIENIESLGTSVHVAAVDVTDYHQMAMLIQQYTSTEQPFSLRGVVHAAGVLASEYITQIEQDSLIRVLTPKVQGSWLLHQLTQELPLDFFVQYSSAAATWGSAMAAHYVAANQFQDSLSHYRRSLGMKALSINWGWWAEGGMVSKEEQAYFDAIGLQVMPSEPAIMALEHWLAAEVTQKTVAPVDWSRYKPVFEAKRQRPFLALIQNTQSEAEVSTVDNALLERLRHATQVERFAMMVIHLQKVIGDLLRLDPAYPIDPQTGFFDVGMDSLTSVELKLRLEQSLGVELPSTLAFEYPTVHDMAPYLLEGALHLGDEPTSTFTDVVIQTVTPHSQAISDEDLEDLSDDDLLALLQDELK